MEGRADHAEQLSNDEIARSIVAIYRGDPTRLELRDMLSPNVVMDDWMMPGRVFEGVDEFCAEWFDEVGTAFPDATEEILSTVFDGSQLVVHAQFRATFAGDHYGIRAHGGPMSWQVIDRWELEDGRIVRVHLMADTRRAHQQLAATSDHVSDGQ